MTKTTVTLNRGGSGETTVLPNAIHIPDLWHIAHRIKDNKDKEDVLNTWHLSHDLKLACIDLVEQRDALLAACIAVRDNWEGNLTKAMQMVNSAIAKAQGL